MLIRTEITWKLPEISNFQTRPATRQTSDRSHCFSHSTEIVFLAIHVHQVTADGSNTLSVSVSLCVREQWEWSEHLSDFLQNSLEVSILVVKSAFWWVFFITFFFCKSSRKNRKIVSFYVNLTKQSGKSDLNEQRLHDEWWQANELNIIYTINSMEFMCIANIA